MRNVLAVLLILFSASMSPATGDAALIPSIGLPPELDRVLRDYEKAWSSHDAAALAALFTEDGFVLANGKSPVRGRPAILSAYAQSGGPLALRALSYSSAGDVAYVIGAYARVSEGPDLGKFVLARRKDARGRWWIAADIDNSNISHAGAPPG